MENRTSYVGFNKSNIEDTKEYGFTEAMEKIGLCVRKHIKHESFEEKFVKGYTWENESDAGIVPDHWTEVKDTRKVLDEFDIWQAGEFMLLAKPL